MMIRYLFVFLILFSINVISCGRARSSDPKETLEIFFKALSKRDINEASKYATKESLPMFGLLQMAVNENMKATEIDEVFKKFSDLEIGQPEIDGDKASVAVTYKAENGASNFVLRKQDGTWKVAFDITTMLNMAKEKMKSGDTENINLDSLQEAIKNINTDSLKDALNKGVEAMDSLKGMLEGLQKH